MKQGCIHIYSGTGKGKTTAAIGLAVRMRGAGGRVLFVQFMKGMPTSETAPLEQLGIDVVRKADSTKFVFAMNAEERAAYRVKMEESIQYAIAHSGAYDLIVLDEVMSAITTGMLDGGTVREFLEDKPKELEVVLTGRDPGEDLIGLADYWSDIEMKRHPYEQSAEARRGIEY